MTKNYYTILGVTPDASTEEIRAAYRRRAKEHHPDRRGGNSEAFLELREAYSVLSDPEQRAAYDNHLREMRRRTAAATAKTRRRWHPGATPEPLAGHHHAAPPDTAASLFRSASHTVLRQTIARLRDLLDDTTEADIGEEISPFSVEVPLSAHQAWTGGFVRIPIPVESVCPECAGLRQHLAFQCRRCLGTGSIVRKFSLTVPFPARLTTDYAVLIPVASRGPEERCLTILFRILETEDF